MVLTLAIPLRKIYQLEDLITEKHLDNCAKLLLVTGLIVFYSYLIETFIAFYSGERYEKYVVINRLFGPYKYLYWSVLFSNIIVPQFLWSPTVRRNVIFLFAISLVIQYGMWAERVMIVITSLHRDFLPSSWGMYYPTFWDMAVFIGSIGLFLFLFLLFIRFLPMISMAEMRELIHENGKGNRQ
jgi:Ni/Fe-hydrogenase subunit HybB-like protein